MDQVTNSGLVRGIRRWDYLALVINGSIGAGIFGLPSKVFALTATYSLFAYLACAILIFLIILCCAEVASRFKDTGGPYLYARQAFGPLVGFEVGWLLWLTRLAGFAAICNLLVSYLAYFWPAAGVGWWRALVITAVVVVLAVINIIGIREVAFVSNIFTIGKLLPLLLFVAIGMFFVDPAQLSFSTQPDYASFSSAVLLLVYMFMGFETTLIPSGEVQEPQRNIPFGLLRATGIVALLYISIQFVCIGTLPGFADSERPLIDAGSRFLGTWGGSVIGVGALLSMIGILHLAMLATPRVPFAMAEQGQFPQILSTTHRRFHTPYFAILITSAIMLALTLSGTFIYLVTMSVIIRLLVYAAMCAALPVLRSRGEKSTSTFTVPAGIVVSVISLVLCLWLLSNSGWREGRDTLIAAAIGLIFYFVYMLKRRGSLSKERVR